MDFAEKVKSARKLVRFSQEDMAHHLGVSFATVNRWESGRFQPSKLASRAFDDFCKANAIVFDSDESSARSDHV